MPGNSWKDLTGTPVNKKKPVDPVKGFDQAAHRPDINLPQVSPKLAALLEQREKLESNMKGLSGSEGGSTQGFDAARYPVSSFKQRSKEQSLWEKSHDLQEKINQPIAQAARTVKDKVSKKITAAPALRSGLKNFEQPVGQWLNKRDGYLDQSRPAAVKRVIGNKLAEGRLALDRLAEDRKKDIGDMFNTSRGKKVFSQIEKKIPSKQKIEKLLEQQWMKKREKITEPMDQSSEYLDKTLKKLNIDTGGSGDLLKRLESSRKKALKMLKEKKQQEQKDQQRREKALQNKKNRG